MTSNTSDNTTPNLTPALPPLSQVRMVITDMDGTLVADDKSLPEGLAEAIDGLAAHGIPLVPASGRQLASLRRTFADFPAVQTFVAENGAIAWSDGHIVGTAPLDMPTAVEVIKRARDLAATTDLDVGVVIAGRETSYVERTDAHFQDTIVTYYTAATTLPDLTDLPEQPLKVAIHSDGPIEPVFERVLAPYAETHEAVLSGAHWCDLMARGVDKGTAIADLQREGGFGPAETIVFGDHLNDLGMFRVSDWGFAVANAHPDVFAVATATIPSNEYNGVIQTIRRLLAQSH